MLISTVPSPPNPEIPEPLTPLFLFILRLHFHRKKTVNPIETPPNYCNTTSLFGDSEGYVIVGCYLYLYGAVKSSAL
ncbi:unnamed protein product [Cercopithifilaria johnstoni]|uniref:Uncharacterized protein n=1 Tax=Cercopithifilaria johnstoni TaxID=2874296 RepID=A0A8J2LQQ2_9BILA|nr:unnamed protein product [Cercopithifilaria johnstoni]